MIVGDMIPAARSDSASANTSRGEPAPVDQADRHDPNVEDLVRTVDAGAEEMLLLAVRVVADVGQEIGGGLDFCSLGLDAAAGIRSPRGSGPPSPDLPLRLVSLRP